MVKQNIVFVENTPGSLQKVTKILAENQIDIYGFGCFDAPEFANFRMVCDNPERADEIMAEHGYMTRITQAILVDLQDEIGGLDKLLSVMGDSNVNLHYIYTFFHRGLKVPVAIMHCEDLLVAESVLRNNGFQVLNRLVGFGAKILFFASKGFGREYLAGIKNGFQISRKNKKVRFSMRNLPRYIQLQFELWINIFRRFAG